MYLIVSFQAAKSEHKHCTEVHMYGVVAMVITKHYVIRVKGGVDDPLPSNLLLDCDCLCRRMTVLINLAAVTGLSSDTIQCARN